MNALRQTVAAMRTMVLETLADSMSLSWGPVTLHVTADTARAATPDGLIDLEASGGFARLAERVAFEEVG